MINMKWLMCFCIVLGFIFTTCASTCIAGERNPQKEESQKLEEEANKPGGKLYFDPDKAEGTHVDDLHITSDPEYVKPGSLRGTHGREAGPAGTGEDRTIQRDVQVIEGEQRFERVED